MSKADKIFKDMCEDILTNGTNTTGELVRPKWADGTPAYTIKKFGVVSRYDLREEFPAITFRQTFIKSAIEEVLWIYQKKSNNIHDLNSKIWDQWADKDGFIGKAYGYQVGKKYQFKQGIMDQMDNVLWALKNEPYSRRIMISLWNTSELHEMTLEPCCWNVIFNVTDEGYDKPILNMILNQRSQDVLTANNWNVCQFAGLLMMVAQASNMIPGVLMHVIADSHIYDRHIPLIKELITRESYPAPIVTLDPDIKDFYQFTKNSFKIENYKFGDQLQIEVAI